MYFSFLFSDVVNTPKTNDSSGDLLNISVSKNNPKLRTAGRTGKTEMM